ncbi:MAG: 1-deoxy-D-xylulose-5-phosphate reductoisomerase [Deinococcus-Thermus bacterium]|jgi:1-deoxy-D-xylulose-5-phosphate reductoisomerase|nr:1-deoxy-D-xylulose-5-phosphate reductoisomerase [Deinococcota bacterium]
MRRVTVLGSTGSIGTQTLDVARMRGWRVTALAAGRNARALIAQAHDHRPDLVVCDPATRREVEGDLPAGTRLASGPDALRDAAAWPADTVVAAIPGMAGLAPVRAALEAGRHVALATKEAMVVAGPLVREAARRAEARITPVDSEHAGVAQLLLGERRHAVHRVVLTASGGPFREEPADLGDVTPEQALAHPTWRMGPKVTIDSATLFNKGLEVLEAHALFDLSLDEIEVVVHPQSLVHALIRYRDGSLKAQVGPHDMRLPILWGVEGVARPELPLPPLPLDGTWSFAPVDEARFPALGLAYEAGRRGGTAPAVLNAADEVAVAAFLEGRLPFLGIPEAIAAALDAVPAEALGWTALHEADAEARRATRAWIAERAAP